MSDRLAHFGRRAKKLIQGADASTDPNSSTWQPRDPTTRTSSQLAGPAGNASATDQPDAVEETVLNEELPPSSNANTEQASDREQPKRSAFPQPKGRTGGTGTRAISAAPGRARTRGEGNAGWNVRTLETSPKRAATQLKDKVKGILQRKGSAESSNSSASSSDQSASDDKDAKPAKTSKNSLNTATKDAPAAALDTIESAAEDPIPTSLRGSGSLGSNPNGSRSGLTSSTWSSSGLVSGGSTLSYLARPALQALAALDEPDSTADLTLPWSGSMNIGGGASGTSSYTSLRARQRELDRQDGEKEAVDIQLLASAALSGCSVVMAESDGPWVWSGVMAEVSDLLRMEPQTSQQQAGGRGKDDGKAPAMAAMGNGEMGTGMGGGTRSRGLVAR